MKIVSDDAIPGVAERFGEIGSVKLLAGDRITRKDLAHADVLLVRSVTRVTQELLDNTSVRFVASATAGTDHVDLSFLRNSSRGFANAPGANAESVVEYVLATLLNLAFRTGRRLPDLTIGIVGCGRIGSRLSRRLAALGCRILCNDPPRARREASFVSVPLFDLVKQSNVVSLHTSLERTGEFRTVGLFSATEFALLRNGAWFVNTSRGETVIEPEMKEWISERRESRLALDVWSNEPTPDVELVELADLATPHIAGYGADGKENATEMIFKAACDFFGIDSPTVSDSKKHAAKYEPEFELVAPSRRKNTTSFLLDIVQQMYDIESDDRRFRDSLADTEEVRGEHFAQLRKNYPTRRTFSRYWINRRNINTDLTDILSKGIGIQLRD